MTILPIVTDDIQTLTKVSKEFDFINPQQNPSELAHDLLETMNSQEGLGLAAIQCNIPLRVFVMRGYPEAYACFNPKIVSEGDEYVIRDEACLSFPGLVIPIKRPNVVRLRFAGPNGEVHTHTFRGLTAKIISHEMDHLDGKLWYNRASKFHRDKGFRKRRI